MPITYLTAQTSSPRSWYCSRCFAQFSRADLPCCPECGRTFGMLAHGYAKPYDGGKRG